MSQNADELDLSTGAAAIEFWIQVDSFNQLSVPLQLLRNYQIKLYPTGVLEATFKSGGNWYPVSGTPLSTNQWYHVSVNRDVVPNGSNVDVYVDVYVNGDLYASNAAAPFLNIPALEQSTADLHIGFDAWGGSEFDGSFDGEIEELRISGRIHYGYDFDQ